MIKNAGSVGAFNAIHLLLLWLCLFCVSAYPTEEDIVCTVMNERSFTIAYTPAQVVVDSDTNGIRGTARMTAQYCGNLFENGKPILPYRPLLCAVPEGGRLVFSIQHLEFEVKEGCVLTPAVKENPEAFKAISKSSEGPDTAVYRQDAFYPASPCLIDRQISLAQRQVAPVRLFPVQYNPRTKQLRVIKKITIRFDIQAATASLARMNPLAQKRLSAFENYLEQKIINHEMIQSWHRSETADKHTEGPIWTGKWFKMAVPQDGVYRIKYSHLEQIGFDSTTIDLSRTGLYTLGGRELETSLSAVAPSLQQVATYFHDQNHDGRFGGADYLLFYGQSTSGWNFDPQSSTYSHYINYYTLDNIYWLNVGHAERIAMSRRPALGADGVPAANRTTALGRIFSEREIFNNSKSGYQWYWDWFRGSKAGHYALALPQLSAADSAKLRIRLQGASEHHHDISIYVNKQLVEKVDLYYTLAKTYEWQIQNFLQAQDNQLQMILNSPSGQLDEFYFDWLEAEYQQRLDLRAGVVDFWSSAGKAVYQISGASQGDWFFDITEPAAVQWIQVDVQDSIAAFQDPNEIDAAGRHYLAVKQDQVKTIAEISATGHPFPNLSSPALAADYLILAPQSLTGPALERLASHRQDSRFWPHDGQPQVKIVTTEEIYDEFSGGLTDPTALRNFLKYAYNHWQTTPSYVLLVGDGCYDIKNNNAAAPPTLIPTFEDQDIATDDWFVCLETEHVPNMCIGRLPVHNQEELAAVVQKIITYDTALPAGPWKNTLTFIADDDYSPANKYEDYVFGLDSEQMAADSSISRFDAHKIYLTEYKRDSFGKKPKARQDLINEINQGCLYVNFLGHGNLEVLTHENIFYSPDDVGYLNNSDRLPLFFAGTCAVGQFDYDRKNSMAEELLLHANGGCVAVIAATRWNAHSITSAINRDFFYEIFSSLGEPPTIGQALMAAKLNSRYPEHRELLALFGDPAQRLALPRLAVQAGVAPDTLSLRKNVLLKGFLTHQQKRIDDFNGSLFVKVYEEVYKRYASEYTYDLTGKLLYADTLSVSHGFFDSQFFLNSDSSKGGRNGRIVCYAWEKGVHGREASGSIDHLPISADTLAPGFRKDASGPEILCTINGVAIDETAESLVEPCFQLNFTLKDRDSGIHRRPASAFSITLQVDHSPDSLWDITSRFSPDDSAAKSGTIAFSVDEMATGKHRLTLSVWDNALNHTTAEWEIEVTPREFSLQEVLTFPNPASRSTAFTFTLSHNAEVKIKVYTVAGRLLQTFQEPANAGFNRIPEDGWDCTDQDGDPLANGVYLYQISAREKGSHFFQSSDRTCQALGRLVIMR